ncbi:MAG TPA: GTP 3',8-cyclase MoaA [Gemmatimonadales bacterium]|nr:GTP 3',8-cyclase MoaA [Gemmatimonadales bacterium]
MSAPPLDRHGRPLGSLRISVTDRCNLRCRYCMPEESYQWLPRPSLLTFEEITRLAAIFARVGVRRIRLTGGEPLLRRDLAQLIAMLAGLGVLDDLALTTNGMLLAGAAQSLRAAGLGRVTISLDTLRPDRFTALTRSARHADVLAGIAAAAPLFPRLKLNTVVMRGVNDDELTDLVEFARGYGAEVRFIEYMDVGGATDWSSDAVVSRQEILKTLERSFGGIEPIAGDNPSAPAERFRLPDGTTVGIIASTTTPFCGRCDRARLTADGVWYLCLYGETGTDLRELLRRGESDAGLEETIRRVWSARTDRGAEARLAAPGRGALYQIGALQADPHREMHTRGG